jgi:hypothetical protein
MNRHLLRQDEPASEFCLLRQERLGRQLPDANITSLTLSEDKVLGISRVAPQGRRTCDAIAFERVSAPAVDGARLQKEWERDHALGFACLRRIPPIVQSRLDSARLPSPDVYR